MSTICDHHDDENFLFDDENNWVKECGKCGPTPKFNGMLVLLDEPDSPEDSPLLINDDDDQSSFHCHTPLVQNDDKTAWKKLLIASILCFMFMVAELVGGYFAGSLAIMTDAAHMFSDFIGFLVSLLAIWVARKPPNRNMTFGYHRAEVLGALLSVLLIWLLVGIFIFLALERIWWNEYEINPDTMIIVALLGLLVNIIMGGVLYGFCHNHSHGLSESHSHENINVRAAAVHVLGDLLQSCGVLLAAVIIKIYPGALLADPICTLIFSIVVICTTTSVAKDAIWLLLEASPKRTLDLGFQLQSLDSVRHVHNLHVWSLAPGKNAVTVHLSADKYCDKDLLLKQATALIKHQLPVVSCTIQIETYSSTLTNSCSYCQSLHC